jgi:hypothetical protein
VNAYEYLPRKKHTKQIQNKGLWFLGGSLNTRVDPLCRRRSHAHTILDPNSDA